MNRWKTPVRVLSVLCALLVAMVAATSAQAASKPSDDPFYKYTGSASLASIAPGTPLKSRTVKYHILGLATPLTTTQLLYRATDAQKRPTTNVTTVIQPWCLFCINREKVLSYQSFYDSLNPADQPSWQIAGNVTIGGLIPNIETALIAPYLLQGYTVVISDTQGQTADFAAGPEYGMNTLDSLRAAMKSSAVDLSNNARIGMIGYSGGAIATEWAAELAPTYAPDVNDNLIGSAYGGVLVQPSHNLHYVEGSSVWAGVMPMAIVGVARSYGIDVTPYLSTYGKQVFEKMKTASIINVLAQYSGLKWTDLAKPEYPTAESVPEYVAAANKVIMGTAGTPGHPQFIGQGANGELEGTKAHATYGKGDGVMIAGDVRTLARKMCSGGTKVTYREYSATSHFLSIAPWLPEAILWLNDRFAGRSASQNCSSIAPGNPLTPIPTP